MHIKLVIFCNVIALHFCIHVLCKNITSRSLHADFNSCFNNTRNSFVILKKLHSLNARTIFYTRKLFCRNKIICIACACEYSEIFVITRFVQPFILCYLFYFHVNIE